MEPISVFATPQHLEAADLVLSECGEYGTSCYITMREWPRFESMRPKLEAIMARALGEKAAGWPQFVGPEYFPRRFRDDGSVEPEHYEYMAWGVRLATDAPARVETPRERLGLLDFEKLPAS